MRGILVSLCLCLIAAAVQGAIIHVPADQPTIQAGIDAALEGDTVLVAPGTYTGLANNNLDFAGKAILLKASGGPSGTDTTYIETDQDADPDFITTHGFYCLSGEDTTTVISGFVIYGGFGYHGRTGGAVYCDNASPKFENCIFRHLQTRGAVYLAGSSAIFRNCRFEHNRSGCDECKSADPRDSVTYMPNGGAAAMERGSDPLFENCVFVDNYADNRSGGAVGCKESSATFLDCLFDNNVAFVRGGEAYLYDATVVFRRCTFTEGEAEGGGGVAAGASTVLFDSCLFYRNTVNTIGLGGEGEKLGSAVLADNASQITLHNCTVVDNFGEVSPSDTLRGSALYSVNGSLLTIENSIIAFNGTGRGVVAVDNVPVISCTDIFGNTGGDWTGALAPLAGINNNFSLNPRFCDLYQDNYTLAATSPCAPPNSSCLSLVGALPVACPTSFRTWHVSPLGNDYLGDGSVSNPFLTIQRGVDVALEGDTVLVAPGTYTGDGNWNISVPIDNLVITSVDGYATTIIDAENSGNDGFHLIGPSTSDLLDSTLIVSGFTVMNAATGILVIDARPTLTDLHLHDNTTAGIADSGFYTHASAVVRRSVIENNGHGIRLSGAWPGSNLWTLIDSCTIANNLGYGIRMERTECPIAVNGCTIEGNAHGLFADQYSFSFPSATSPREITETTFLNNDTAAAGNLTMRNCQILGGQIGVIVSIAFSIDSCLFDGIQQCAIRETLHHTSGGRTIMHCTIQKNPGDILYGHAGDTRYVFADFINCTIADNGGGIRFGSTAGDAHLSMRNCLYRNNGPIALTLYGARGDLLLSSVVIESAPDTAVCFKNYASGWNPDVSLSVSNCVISGSQGPALAIRCDPNDAQTISISHNTIVGGLADALSILSLGATPAVALERNIIAFNQTAGLRWVDPAGGSPTMSCNDIFENNDNNYVGLPDPTGTDGNISRDPLFCDTALGDYRLFDHSPCTADSSACDSLIGARSVGCTCCLARGDAEHDGTINVADITFLIAWVFRGGSAAQCPTECDLVTDSLINISDVTLLIAYVFRGGPSPPPCPDY